MRWTIGPILMFVVACIGGCAEDERQWLKLNQKYTTEDFRRDHAECSKGGKLDDGCMRSRGWVAVNPFGKTEVGKDPYARDVGATAPRRY